MGKMTEQQKADKYGMKWFRATFHRDPIKSSPDSKTKKEQKPVAYVPDVPTIYRLIDKYEKLFPIEGRLHINKESLVEDLKSIMQPEKERPTQTKRPAVVDKIHVFKQKSLHVSTAISERTIRGRNNGLENITVHADGYCAKNPGGKGGFGVVIEGLRPVKLTYQGFVKSTTNNRMELFGILFALARIKEKSPNFYKLDVKIVSDSEYALKSLSVYKHCQANLDIIDPAKILLGQLKDYSLVWVKGHANCKENILADALASGEKKAQVVVDESEIEYLLEAREENDLDKD